MYWTGRLEKWKLERSEVIKKKLERLPKLNYHGDNQLRDDKMKEIAVLSLGLKSITKDIIIRKTTIKLILQYWKTIISADSSSITCNDMLRSLITIWAYNSTNAIVKKK